MIKVGKSGKRGHIFIIDIHSKMFFFLKKNVFFTVEMKRFFGNSYSPETEIKIIPVLPCHAKS